MQADLYAWKPMVDHRIMNLEHAVTNVGVPVKQLLGAHAKSTVVPGPCLDA
jgi:hypothetical protein